MAPTHTELRSTGGWLPGLQMLRRYERPWLRPDVIGGVTVAAYAIPQCMAYAEVARLPASVGLWAAIGPMVLYALVGSSRHLSAGPESTTSVMTASLLLPLAAGDPSRYAALAAAAALLVGVLALLGRLARLGFVASLLSRPVLVGYLAGMAILMIVGQLGRVTGIDLAADDVLPRVREWVSELGNADPWTVGIAVFVLVVLVVVARVSPSLPGPLIAVVLAGVIVAVLSLEDEGVAVVGEVSTGLPGIDLGTLTVGDLRDLLGVALALVVVAYSDNTLESRAFASRNGYRVDANTELVALGVTNLASGAVGGYPISSSGSRTAIAEALGIRSQAYSLVAAATIVVVAVLGGGLLARFPTAALGAIVIWAACKLVDVGEIRRLARFRMSEVVLALATAAAVVAFDVLIGILLAVALSVVELMQRLSRPHDAICGRVPGLAGLHDVDDYPEAAVVPGLVVYRYDAPLCFANAEFFKQRVLDAVADGQRHGRVEWLLLNVEAIVEMDMTAADVLAEIHDDMTERGIVLALARVKHDLLVQLDAAGLADVIGHSRMYPTLPVALEAFASRHDDATSP